MRFVYPLILAGICCSGVPAMAAIPVPDCAGGVEIPRAHIVRVERNGALILSDGRAVLLEGIRLPLAERPALAEEALAQLRTLAMATPLTLAATAPKQDRYDRVRVQAFGDVWLQLEMLHRGLARVQTAPDRSECAPDFYEAEQAARRAARGLWAFANYAIRRPDAVKNDIGTFQIVEGPVVNVSDFDGGALEFSTDRRRGFAAVIAPEDRRAFRNLDPTLEELTGRRIRVRGVVTLVQGRPQIGLFSPSQIEIIP